MRSFGNYFGLITLPPVAFLVIILLAILAYQAHAMAKIRRPETDIVMVDRITRHMNLLVPLYAEFSAHGFSLTLEGVSPRIERALLILARDFARVGTLFLTGAFDQSIMLHLHADLCIRTWIMLEPYVRRERERRCEPSWMWEIQYFLLLSLQYHVQTPTGSVTIYNPKDPSVRKTWDRQWLRQMLHDTKLSSCGSNREFRSIGGSDLGTTLPIVFDGS